MDGAVRSMWMPPTVADVALPALSDTAAVADNCWPSPPTTVSAGTVAGSTPDVASAAVHCTVTSPWYQPAPLGSVLGAPVRVGAVASKLMSPTAVEAVRPTPST